MRGLDSYRDLTKGEREYLIASGISLKSFDEMTPKQQMDWKRECEENAYDWLRKNKNI